MLAGHMLIEVADRVLGELRQNKLPEGWSSTTLKTVCTPHCIDEASRLQTRKSNSMPAKGPQRLV